MDVGLVGVCMSVSGVYMYVGVESRIGSKGK